MTNPGATILRQTASTALEAAVAEAFTQVASNANDGFLRISELTRLHGFHEDALRRFLNAATSLGLAQRVETDSYTIRTGAATSSRTPAEALFWLVNSGLAERLIAQPISLESFTAKPTFDSQRFETAKRVELLESNGSTVSLAPALHDVLSPQSRLYMGLWVQNYERVMSPILSPKGLAGALRNGRTQWPAIFGADVSNPFELTKVYPGIFKDLMEGMHQANITEDEVLAGFVTQSGVRTILDIGGASGAWATALADANNQLDDIQIYDLADGLPLYQSIYSRHSGSKLRPISWVAGNFFEGAREDRLTGLSETAAFDLVTLGWITHDWTDDQAIKILRRAAGHMNRGGRMLLLESILPDDRLGRVTLADLAMLVQTGGRERTIGDYRALLTRAGLQITNVVDTPTRRQIIEAGRI